MSGLAMLSPEPGVFEAGCPLFSGSEAPVVLGFFFGGIAVDWLRDAMRCDAKNLAGRTTDDSTRVGFPNKQWTVHG